MTRTRYTATDYVDITPLAAHQQWIAILGRSSAGPGQRQENFTPVETLLCLAAMYLVDSSRFSSAAAVRAPAPVPELARLFRRPPTSIVAKMDNLDGSRPKGNRNDILVAATLRSDPERLAVAYRACLAGARAAGVDVAVLPDFLGIEAGGQVALLGQDELGLSVLELAVEEALQSFADAGYGERETERIALAAVRVGQHRFARDVLANCGHACVFCGFAAPSAGPSHLLRASHVKPWRDATRRERLHVANGVAACPTHDAAFDQGLLTIEDDLRITLAPSLVRDRERRPEVRRYFESPHLYDHVALPAAATIVDVQYAQWHRVHIYQAG
ncbi:HNH endonuclease [Cellulomonas dongxiuzhuiae]|uniref:HNH endonuclease n=1 Tax=Cellulomonas dongxiuzhuiae TaxID=2819979 RepID=UPI001AAE7E19|nr:HNH endonuclease [Cellulomonas dongxiuzhuiae]MBO3089435.1 HNH endonuclease [Cellulomonas dongxiuzhuiae]